MGWMGGVRILKKELLEVLFKGKVNMLTKCWIGCNLWGRKIRLLKSLRYIKGMIWKMLVKNFKILRLLEFNYFMIFKKLYFLFYFNINE